MDKFAETIIKYSLSRSIPLPIEQYPPEYVEKLETDPVLYFVVQELQPGLNPRKLPRNVVDKFMTLMLEGKKLDRLAIAAIDIATQNTKYQGDIIETLTILRAIGLNPDEPISAMDFDLDLEPYIRDFILKEIGFQFTIREFAEAKGVKDIDELGFGSFGNKTKSANKSASAKYDYNV